nr:MAG TPA: hypothetical protein [Caudoviricetes sp.]
MKRRKVCPVVSAAASGCCIETIMPFSYSRPQGRVLKP